MLTSFSVSSYPILRILISHTSYHHIPYSVSSYHILRIIIYHTPYHHIPYFISSYTIPYSALSYPMLLIIIYHTLYHHISYSVLSYPILRIIISHTPCHHITYSVSSYIIFAIQVFLIAFLYRKPGVNSNGTEDVSADDTAVYYTDAPDAAFQDSSSYPSSSSSSSAAAVLMSIVPPVVPITQSPYVLAAAGSTPHMASPMLDAQREQFASKRNMPRAPMPPRVRDGARSNYGKKVAQIGKQNL